MFKTARELGANCDDCPLKNQSPVFPEPPSKNHVLIACGEAPGKVEEQEGKYFVGPTGQFFNRVLNKYKIPRGKIHVTNALMCRPPGPLAPDKWKQALECCRPRLELELKKCKTKTILGMGKKALQMFTGRTKIFDWVGAPLPCLDSFKNYTILPSFHPAFCFRPDGRNYSPVVFIHIARAWALATGQLKPWKWPPIFIEPDEKALRALQKIKREKLPTGFDIETRGTNPMKDTIMCLSLSNKHRAVCVPWESYYARKNEYVPSIGATATGRRIARLVRSILEDRGIPKVFQNGPHDILGAERLGIHVRNYAFDTLLAHAIVAQGMKHNLGFICSVEFHAPRWKQEAHTASNEKGHRKFSRRDPRELRTYCAKDSWMTNALVKPLTKRLHHAHNGMKLFQENYMTNIRIAIDMQRYGFPVDDEKRRYYRRRLLINRAQAIRELREVTAKIGLKSYNALSWKSNNALFFGKLKVAPKYFSEITKAPSMPEKFISELVSHHNYVVSSCARKLLRVRKWQALLKYTQKKYLDENNVSHPTWNVHGARTFRWSCSDPNLQNIPKRKNKGMRSMFWAGSGNYVVCGDYDQLELRIIAMLAGDKPLVDIFNSGADPHLANAADIFGKRPEDIDRATERVLAKVAVYQMNYGGDPVNLWKVLTIDFPMITIGHVHRIHTRWFAKHTAILNWQNSMLRQCREKGYIEAPISGHRLHFYGKVDPNKVYNYPVQHTAADIINPAIPKVRAALRKNEHILAQVHDELVVGGPDPLHLAEVLQKCMTTKIMGMTYSVGVKIGTNWGNCIELNPSRSLKTEVRRVVRELKAH